MRQPPVPFTILLVTNHLEARPKGGRELLCKLNHDLLNALAGDALAVFHLERPQHQRRGLRSLIGDTVRGYIDGVNPAAIKKITDIIASQPRLDKVFIDGSNLGALAVAVKRRFPRVEVITFFHNVESRFFLGSFRARRTAHAAGVLLANYVAERGAVRASDKRICLSERDSRLLRKVYGMGGTHVAPMALEDKLPGATDCGDSTSSKEPFALFVGGTFYANRVGIEWYVDNVAPQSKVKVLIVGRGFEAMRQRLEASDNVKVIGEVDDLSAWYRDAQFVIAPIFDGSGMKTKVAEALMYGKKVVGTPEAFSGYEEVLPEAGWVCASATEFAATVAKAMQSASAGLDPQLRQMFVERYSQDAAKRRMAAILGAAPAGAPQREQERAA